MSELDDRSRLQHALQSAELVLDAVAARGLNIIFSDPLLIGGVERHLAIIGEAINKLSPDFRDRHPELEWKKIVRFRNFLVHEYFAIDYAIVVDILQVKLPALATVLSQLLSTPNAD